MRVKRTTYWASLAHLFLKSMILVAFVHHIWDKFLIQYSSVGVYFPALYPYITTILYQTAYVYSMLQLI